MKNLAYKALILGVVLSLPLDKQSKDQLIYAPDSGRTAIQMGPGQGNKAGTTFMFELSPGISPSGPKCEPCRPDSRPNNNLMPPLP
jgi:hypothetical protein